MAAEGVIVAPVESYWVIEIGVVIVQPRLEMSEDFRVESGTVKSRKAVSR